MWERRRKCCFCTSHNKAMYVGRSDLWNWTGVVYVIISITLFFPQQSLLTVLASSGNIVYMAFKRPLSISIPSLPFTCRYCILYHCTSAYRILHTEVMVHSLVTYKCPCKKLLLKFVMFGIWSYLGEKYRWRDFISDQNENM
jgi:hypothetical protein